MNHVIGVDIGGTKINAAFISESGEIVEKVKVKTQADLGKDVVLKNIEKAIKMLPYDKAIAVGIGSPGFIDSENGIVTFAGNIKNWSGLHLTDEVKKFIDLPVFLENDANIALLCEKWIGSCKDFDNIVMITLGTGLGGAVYNEKMGLLEGSHFQGAELGHMIMYPGGRLCTCGQKGCAERYCSGSAITEHYHELTGFSLSGEEILSMSDYDDDAKRVLLEFQTNLANYLSTLRNIFDPEVIVIGGGVINSRNLWWNGMMEKYNEVCNKPQEVKIVSAQYLNDSGVIGAGKAAFDRYYGKK